MYGCILILENGQGILIETKNIRSEREEHVMKLGKSSRQCMTIVILVFAIAVTACGRVPSSSPVNDSNADEQQVVEIQNGDRLIRFDEAPSRAVSLNQHVTEIMLALGLQDSMVGTAYLDDEILPQWQEAYGQIPVLSDQYPSQEVLLAAEPDFVYAGWKSAFAEDAVGSIEELESFGIQSYLHQSSNMVAPTTDDVFEDILNIGRIFRVEDRAEELIHSIQDKIDEISDKLGMIEQPIRVFVYDSGEKEPFTAAQNYLNHLITLAGGHNIFGDIDKGWASASWEEVVNRDPEIIVIMDYGNTTVEDKKAFLLQHPALKDVSAIQQQRFVVLPLSAGAEGVRVSQSLETLAKAFYPDKFES